MNKEQLPVIIAKAVMAVVLALACLYLGNFLLKPATGLLAPFICSATELEQPQLSGCEWKVVGVLILAFVLPYKYLASFGFEVIEAVVDSYEDRRSLRPTRSATGFSHAHPGSTSNSTYPTSSPTYPTESQPSSKGYRETLAERMKEEVGMATPGTTEYRLNAAKVLSQYADPDKPLRADTREKLEALARSSDPQTSYIAWKALNGERYDPDDDDDDREGY